MKIAYFLDIPYGVGGAGNLLLQQAKLMSDLYEVMVVIPSDINGKTNEEYARRCVQYSLSYCSLQYTSAYNFCNIDFCGSMESAKNIEEFVKKEKISFLHSVQLNIALEYVARKLKIPHVMDIYQLREEEFMCCPGDIYPHYHICDSELYRNRWSTQLGIQSECIRPVALLDKMKKKDDYPKKNIHVLMLGAVCERKNQLVAIKACEACMDFYNVKLMIAGNMSSNYAKSCIQYVKEHGLQKKIVFKGFVNNVIPLLENSDCLLCTSTDESFPSSMVEALTYDLTVVSTPVAGVPEVFKNGVNSFISKDFSSDSVRKSLMECMYSYESGDIAALHKRAEDTWINCFARSKVREQIDAYYQYIMKYPYTQIGDFPQIIRNVERLTGLLSEVYKNCEGMQQRVLYHAILEKELKQGRMYLWGAGKLGGYAYQILQVLCPELEIIAFIDRKKKGVYYGIPIIKPEEMLIDKSNFYAVGFWAGNEQAIQYLEAKGLELNKQIWVVP